MHRRMTRDGPKDLVESDATVAQSSIISAVTGALHYAVGDPDRGCIYTYSIALPGYQVSKASLYIDTRWIPRTAKIVRASEPWIVSLCELPKRRDSNLSSHSAHGVEQLVVGPHCRTRKRSNSRLRLSPAVKLHGRVLHIVATRELDCRRRCGPSVTALNIDMSALVMLMLARWTL
jgi:hypothetical protein